MLEGASRHARRPVRKLHPSFREKLMTVERQKFGFGYVNFEMSTRLPVFLPGESQGWEAWWAAVYGSHRVGHD